MENKFLQNHKIGSLYQKKGDFDIACKYFKKNLNISVIKLHVAALFHLAQMEADWDKKREYLKECLVLEPTHRMAKVLLSCLTPAMKKRLETDNDGVIRSYFERYPLNIQIQTISTCNGKCIMCPYHQSWHKTNPGKMTEEMFMHIIHLFKNIPLGKICLYLENEPIMDGRIFDWIKLIKKNLFFRHLEISTNVSLLNEENIQQLVKSLQNIDHEVWLSWHGITPKNYKKLMGFDFEKNLQKLKLYLKITEGKLNTVINSIVGNKLDKNQSYSGEEETVSFFENILIECGIKKKTGVKIKPFLFHDRAGSIKNGVIFDEKLDPLFGKLKPNCCRIKEWLHILYDGDMILCCMDYHKETVMGNIMNFKSLKELFNSDTFLSIQKQSLGQLDSKNGFICKRCLSPGG